MVDPVKDLDLVEQGAAPVSWLLQAVVGPGQLDNRDARAGGRGNLPVDVGRPAYEQRGLLRFLNGGHDGDIAE
jgi:hypothetical protein